MQQIADWVQRPAHRIIHLCERGVVKPTVPSRGRGSMRRFNREDTFRVLIGLMLQEASIPAPAIKPLMAGLTALTRVPELKVKMNKLEDADLPALIASLGTISRPVLAFLPKEKFNQFIIPGHEVAVLDAKVGTIFITPKWSEEQHITVAVLVNLTTAADLVA